MAMRFIDSMQHYDSALVYRKWNVPGTASIISTGGRRNAPYLSIQGGANGITLFKTLTPTDTWIMGAAFLFANSGNYGTLFSLGNASGNSYLAGLVMNSDNTVSFWNGNNFNDRIGISTIAINPVIWNYIEASFAFSGGTGTITLTGTCRLNGDVILVSTGIGAGYTGSSLAFPGPYMNVIQMGGPSPALQNYGIQDFYCLDTSPIDINGNTTSLTTFLGDVEIDALFPDQDITTNMSTFGGDGTHAYSCVNETSPDDDTSYVYTSNTGNSEAFEYQPITGLNGTILGAQYLVCAKKDAEGLREFAMSVNGGTVASLNFATQTGSNSSTSQYLSDYYNYYICPMDSCDGTTWGTSVFNTSTFGITLTT